MCKKAKKKVDLSLQKMSGEMASENVWCRFNHQDNSHMILTSKCKVGQLSQGREET